MLEEIESFAKFGWRHWPMVLSLVRFLLKVKSGAKAKCGGDLAVAY